MFLEAVDADYLEFCCPNHNVLFETPDASQRGDTEERLMAFFVDMLDGFTQPHRPYEPPLCFPIVRSAPNAH